MAKLNVVFLSDWLQNPYKDLLSSGLETHEVKVAEYQWQTLFIHYLLKTERPTVLHLHTLHPFLRGKNGLSRTAKLFIFVSQILLLRLAGIKTVWTVHEWTDKISEGKDDLSDFSCRLIGQSLTAFITHCKSTKEQIQAAFYLGNKQKVFTIPHGNYIDCYPNEINRKAAREKLGINLHNATFLLFGDLYRYKGVLEAIDAFQLLDQTSTTLLIAGRPSQETLEDEISDKIGKNSNIIFSAHRVADNSVQIYMNAADCVLVPYTVFTTSGIAILAMSFGRTCIAPNIGFFSDMLDSHGAFLYPPDSTSGLSNAMKTALKHQKSLTKMGNYNLEVANQWNWNYVAKSTLDVYNI